MIYHFPRTAERETINHFSADQSAPAADPSRS
jgi:hypothetical protein